MILAGQIWSFASGPWGQRVRFRVLAVEGDTATIRYERSGRTAALSASMLRQGLRAARLELDADGAVPAPAPPSRWKEIARERATKAIELSREGVSAPEIARRIGVSATSVYRYVREGA